MPNTFRLSLVFAASAAVLAACATPASQSAQAGLRPTQTTAMSVGRGDDGALYGLFLSGQAALNAGRSAEAADLFARARAADPSAEALRERAFIASLMAGDITHAAAAAPPIASDGKQSTETLGALAQGVELIADDKGAEAYAKLSELPLSAAHGEAAALLRPWAAAEAGKWDAALAAPAPTKGDRLFQLIGGLDQAMLFERAKRYGEAETSFKALLADTAARPLVAPAYGAFLERRGRRQEAIAAYDSVLADAPDDTVVVAARARAAGKGAPPPQMTIRQAAAQALMAPAAAMQSEKQLEVSLVYLRLILRLDPTRDDAWMYAGQIMASVGDQDSAREAFQHVAPSSSRYVLARAALAATYQGKDKAQALKIVQETAASHPDDPDAQVSLAEMLRANERNDEAAKVMDAVIAAAGAHADWRLYYLRGAALERANRWPEAQADFAKALALKPDDPELLNYVGYSWVSRGQKVKEGLAMIQKAVGLDPDNGAYVDSLGWAYYQLGDYRKAVEQLERASELLAGDPEINDHLGDAYWRAGRRQEARFKWTEVLTLDPTPEQKPKVEAKLASPVGVDAVAAPTVARQ